MRNNIKARHDKKLNNLKTSHNCPTDVVDKSNWVVNLSKKPVLPSERSLLEKGLKFAPTPSKIPFKDFVAEVEASRIYLMNLKIKYEPLRLQSSYGLLYLIGTSLKKKAKLYMSKRKTALESS